MVFLILIKPGRKKLAGSSFLAKADGNLAKSQRNSLWKICAQSAIIHDSVC
jgi:hypothetical protein